MEMRKFRVSMQETCVISSIFAQNPHFHDCTLASPPTAGL
jgi:hypothetical protein